MSEMVERVARALFEGRQAQSGATIAWESLSELRKDIWRPDARAAIAAMREPTFDMVNDGGNVWIGETEDHANLYAGDGVAENIWKAMIEAALK